MFIIVDFLSWCAEEFQDDTPSYASHQPHLLTMGPTDSNEYTECTGFRNEYYLNTRKGFD